MNQQFAHHTERMPSLYQQLMRGDELPLSPQASWKKLGAIYVFFHDGRAEHVGRTRNLQSRIRGHLSDSHYSASFAFKQTRRELSLVATYRPEGSRAALFAREDFRAAFRDQSLRLRGMTMRFLAVDCPVDQYLLELYATMELGLNLDEFDTHQPSAQYRLTVASDKPNCAAVLLMLAAFSLRHDATVAASAALGLPMLTLPL